MALLMGKLLFLAITTVLAVFGYTTFTGEDKSLNFLVLGDQGGSPLPPYYYTKMNYKIAETMNTEAKARNTQFQLTLGDNIYYYGVRNVEDKRFKKTFEDLYSGEYLQNDWYMIAGNHDYWGNISAQILYTQVSKRWKYPDYYYTKTFTSPDGATIEFVMVDTMIICGTVEKEGEQPKPFDDKEAEEEEWAWIEEKLANSTADYLVVGGHYPVYSAGFHGPTEKLVERMKPLLYQYKVSAYFSGHDHTLQHLHEVTEDGEMDYMVTGSATNSLNIRWHKDDVPPGSLKFWNADTVDGGFAAVSVNKELLTFTFISGEGLELYQTTVKPRSL